MSIIARKESFKNFSNIPIQVPYYRIEKVTNYGYEYSIGYYEGYVNTYIFFQKERKFLFWKLKDKIKIKQDIPQGKQTDGKDIWITLQNNLIQNIALREKYKALESIKK